MKRQNWIWMPHPGHFICAAECKFILNTYVGKFIVSTVGEWLPDSQVREILAEARKVKLVGKGDTRKHDYMKKIGFEEIGCDRKYETMVFLANKEPKDQCCMFEVAVYENLDFDSYNDPKSAYIGHMRLCEKWSKRAAYKPAKLA